MMNRFTLIAVTFAFACHVCAQTLDCANIGFEQGNTSGWVLSYGTVTAQDQKTVFLSESPGTHENEHYVTRLSDGNDPNITAEAIPMVAPGSTHSIRIGHTSVGGHYTRISAKYRITEDNSLFQYQFAVVLQNTSGIGGGFGAFHEPYQKPGFNLLIFDENGEELPCSHYDIQLQGMDTVEGFKSQGDLQYRNWTTGSVDLRSIIGRTVTIVVTVHGCTQRRHFGYAYFDAQCFRSEVTLASKCPDENGLTTLVAPEGFAKYAWSTGSNDRTTKVKANPGDTYSVGLLPLSSLDETCQVRLDHQIRFNKVETVLDETICEGESFTVGDTAYATSGNFVRNVIASSTCDSTVHLRLRVNPVPHYEQHVRICAGDSLVVGDAVYRLADTYHTVIHRGLLCDSLVTTFLEVDEFTASTETDQLTMTQGESVELAVYVDPGDGQFLYRWSPQEAIDCHTCPVTWAKPERSLVYSVNVTTPGGTCPQTKNIAVLVKACGVGTPMVFTPNQDGANDRLFVLAGSCIRLIREFVIYDRWGEVVFRAENFEGASPDTGWDGTYLGKPAVPGAFACKILAERSDGKLIRYQGGFTLIR